MSESFPFYWQRVKACPVYPELLAVWGEYGYRRNDDADEDDRGGHVAWEVWHWPSNSVESDWFTQADATREARRLYAAMRWPECRHQPQRTTESTMKQTRRSR
jgi:hypothetical protein